MSKFKSSAIRSFGGKGVSQEKLMSTKARDCKDCLSAKNEQGESVGKSGASVGLLGKKGREF